jgi:hypothetical protein
MGDCSAGDRTVYLHYSSCEDSDNQLEIRFPEPKWHELSYKSVWVRPLFIFGLPLIHTTAKIMTSVYQCIATLFYEQKQVCTTDKPRSVVHFRCGLERANLIVILQKLCNSEPMVLC